MSRLVSIITPSYNCADYVGATIESIQSQTYRDWELLITDDCSTDDSREVISRYVAADPRIKLFCLDRNSGAGVARNNSIREAQGRYMAFCDSDDRWLPDKLQRQLDFMQRRGARICYSSYYTCDEDGEENGLVVAYRKITYRELCRDDSIGFLTLVYDMVDIGKVYMPELRRRQDWAMKLLLMQRCREAHGLIEPLAIYRMRANSLSRNKSKLVKYNVEVYHEVLRIPYWRSWLKFVFQFMPWHVAKRLRLRIINQ